MTAPDPAVEAFMARAAQLLEQTRDTHALLALTKAATDALAVVVEERDVARAVLEEVTEDMSRDEIDVCAFCGTGILGEDAHAPDCWWARRTAALAPASVEPHPPAP